VIIQELFEEDEFERDRRELKAAVVATREDHPQS
jgi:hypothetical protein